MITIFQEKYFWFSLINGNSDLQSLQFHRHPFHVTDLPSCHFLSEDVLVA